LDLATIKAKVEADSMLCNAEKANWQMQQTML
jgi:membrane fusion protein, multidrug efflux system